MAVADKRRKWLINGVLLVAVMAFVGISLLPLLSAVQTEQPSPSPVANSPSPTASPDDIPNRAELETLARGYEAVLKNEPDNQTALKELVRVRAQLRDPQGALAPLERLVQLNPNEPDYAVLLAQVKEEVNDPDGAAQIYRDVLAKQPGNLNVLRGFSSLLVNQNRPEAAIALLQDTIKSAPQINKDNPGTIDVASVNIMLGEVYGAAGRSDEAIAVFDDVAAAAPTDFRPVLGKALVLKRQGKPEEAKALFEQAAELAPPAQKDQIRQMATQPLPNASPSPAPTAAPAE